jgi:hypothetical protein
MTALLAVVPLPAQEREADALAIFISVLIEDPRIRLPLKARSWTVRELEQVRAQVPADEVTRPHVLIPTIVGGGLLTSGGVLWGLAKRALSRLVNADPETTKDEDLRHMASKGETYQALGFSLLEAGAVSLGIATMLYLRRKSQVSTTLGVGINGASVIAYGRWP